MLSIHFKGICANNISKPCIYYISRYPFLLPSEPTAQPALLALLLLVLIVHRRSCLPVLPGLLHILHRLYLYLFVLLLYSTHLCLFSITRQTLQFINWEVDVVESHIEEDGLLNRLAEESPLGSLFEGTNILEEGREVFRRNGDDGFVDGRREEVLSLTKIEGSIGEELNSR